MSTNPTPSMVTEDEDVPLLDRIRENPRPAINWGAVMAVLVLLELGAVISGTTLILRVSFLALTALLDVALGWLNSLTFGLLSLINSYVDLVVDALVGELPVVTGVPTTVVGIQQVVTDFLRGIEKWGNSTVPTLLSRELIPNRGYWNGNRWVGTFLGLEPGYAWMIRAGLVYVYSAVTVYWVVHGYFVFRRHYRKADWTPRDDVIDRLSRHRWGQFGAVIVFMFLTMALFAPTLGPTTVKQNIKSPYGENHRIKYWDVPDETDLDGDPVAPTAAGRSEGTWAMTSDGQGRVEVVFAGDANFNSKSKGAGSQNVGVMRYDDFGRYHPFGTLPNGRDLFTFMVAGSRISLFVGLVSIGLGGFIATALALASAYYKGLVDLANVLASDSIMSLPQLLFLIMVSVAFQNHWLGRVYDGGLLIALIFAFTYWPGLWRAIRGPAFQVSEQEWVDAAKSYGQRTHVIMQKHMLPYILGYLLIYGSMSLGGVIIGTSALSFLGLGIKPPTPEWGRAIALGQQYVTTQSWHISIIPGVLIVLVVTAFNALGDGIRDAIDPKSEGGQGGETTVAAGGGG